jgi:hypothetical protein
MPAVGVFFISQLSGFRKGGTACLLQLPSPAKSTPTTFQPCHFSIFYWAKILNQILLKLDIWKTGFLPLLAVAVADSFSCLV